ncbi:MAG: CNNM domain-containing protein, partial [Bdellovibrionales bacterium]|nr:CNNM domain-containing protein [Bdellovibrionales bacterium]
SLVEAALLSMSPSQVARISEANPRLGEIWQKLKLRVDRPLAVILILNTSAHTIGASFAGAQFDDLYGEEWIWLFSLVFTYLMLQFAEILPKSLGVRFNQELAPVIGPVLTITSKALAPVIDFVHWVNKPFEIGRKRTTSSTPTVDDITSLAALARLTNQIGSQEEKIIKAASKLSRTRVEQIMIPIEDVCFLTSDMSVIDAVSKAQNDLHTRFPVTEMANKNFVIGYVNFKDLIFLARNDPAETSLRSVMRPMFAASPGDLASELLRLFTDQHIHIAIVRNPEGKTVGLITLEDLLEELVGDLEDEFDRIPKMFHPLSGDRWMVGGGLQIHDLFHQLKISDPLSNPPPPANTTVSTWLSTQLGLPVHTGGKLQFADFEFQVRRVRKGRPYEVAVRKVK